MTGHTSGKWEVSGKLPYIIATTAPPYRLSGETIISRGTETGGQDWPAISNEEREANAKHICKSVNGWDELVMALESVQRYNKAAKERRVSNDEGHEYWEVVMDYVKQALANAQKE